MDNALCPSLRFPHEAFKAASKGAQSSGKSDSSVIMIQHCPAAVWTTDRTAPDFIVSLVSSWIADEGTQNFPNAEITN